MNKSARHYKSVDNKKITRTPRPGTASYQKGGPKTTDLRDVNKK